MAAHFEDEDPQIKECANCGSMENLALCSRCHTAWFCSVKCQKAYWPFHREWCRRNDFADAIEKTEPKFARWMRKHGKQAVLKDDEVDRIERKVCTYEDLYGRANPKPLPPKFTAEDMEKMRIAEEEEMLRLRGTSRRDELWLELEVPENLGLELPRYKWRQDQSWVEVFVQLPEGLSAKMVSVELEPDRISVVVDGEVILEGDLFASIKVEDSTWIVRDGILEVLMLKKNRRGHYDDGKTNADTFWYAVNRRATNLERLALPSVPNEYYSTRYEKDDGKQAHQWRRSAKYDRPDRKSVV